MVYLFSFDINTNGERVKGNPDQITLQEDFAILTEQPSHRQNRQMDFQKQKRFGFKGPGMLSNNNSQGRKSSWLITYKRQGGNKLS